MRLDRFLAESTDLTRSLAKRALIRGEVSVNGELEKKAARHVEEADRVVWLGESLSLVGVRYIMLHKPEGVECTARRGSIPARGSARCPQGRALEAGRSSRCRDDGPFAADR